MSKSKAFIVAALALGVTSGVQAHNNPRRRRNCRKRPNMTFFVTGAGPGKGADLGGIEGADQHCQSWRSVTARAEKPGAPISAPRRPTASRPSMRATASAKARGRTSKATVVATSVDDLHSDNNKLGFDNSLSERGLIIPGVGFAPNRHDVLTGSTRKAAPSRPARIAPARTGRAAPRARRWSAISTARACATMRRRSRGIRIASLARSRRRLQPERSARHRRRRAVLLLRHPVGRLLQTLDRGPGRQVRPPFIRVRKTQAAISFLVSKFSSISTLLGSRRKICQRVLLGTWFTRCATPLPARCCLVASKPRLPNAT